jgi:hypothetical protein
MNSNGHFVLIYYVTNIILLKACPVKYIVHTPATAIAHSILYVHFIYHRLGIIISLGYFVYINTSSGSIKQ